MSSQSFKPLKELLTSALAGCGVAVGFGITKPVFDVWHGGVSKPAEKGPERPE